ncbi:MAG: 4-hydroxy-3-methylbut-2-enyl diphosphate reductase [Treponema sp.]|nr:4-hydroxy-3-methylbut-2-enyl diphosphate reductase [Treponema sp.]
MEIVRSELLGFCSGVSRAIKSALDALGAEDGGQKPKKIYSLGPLIHNQIVLDQLSQKGLKILQEDQIDSLDADCLVIVRAHGVSPLVLEKIRAKGAQIVDATCPRVALSQRRAAEFSQKGMFVILTGDKGHAEVKAVEGSALFAATDCKAEPETACKAKTSGRFVLVQNVSEAAALAVLPEMKNNAVLLSQTTFSPEEYKKISEILSEKIEGLKVFDTICPATGERQKALAALAKKVDALVVVGGKKSANSERLYELAKTLCPASYFVESADELPKDFGDAKVIGLTAGASSPDFVIDAVEARIQAMRVISI